jgi:hypothetical protein
MLRSKSYLPRQSSIFGQLLDRNFWYHSVNHSESLLLGYNQRKSTFLEQKAMNMAPDPTGISGGGIWFIPEYNVPAVENVEYLLCGILIEHYNKQNLIKATKIEEVIQLLRGLRHKSADQ